MNITRMILGPFRTKLVKEGFVQDSKDPLVFSRLQARKRDILEFDMPSYISGFGITLSSRDSNGQQRRETLQSFRGINFYRIDLSQEESIQDAIDLASGDFINFGIPWFSGTEIQTDSVVSRRALIEERNFADRVALGRKLFKSGLFLQAVEAFDSAESLRELGAVDKKFRDIARTRQPMESGR